ncbi:MAG: hypothetical protein ACP5E3_00965 [Bacteroidales bacterium]
MIISSGVSIFTNPCIYTYNVKYDLAAGAMFGGLKLNYIFSDQNGLRTYFTGSVGMISLLSWYHMAVTGPYLDGHKRATLTGNDMMMRVGLGLEVDNMFAEIGFQNAKIKEMKYTIDQNDFYPEAGESGTMLDENGEKIPADFSCIYFNVGWKFRL